jgi:hypothetical protein
MPRDAGRAAARVRDKCPASALLDESDGPAETGLAGKHDGLITVLDADLVEHPGDVVANRAAAGYAHRPGSDRKLRTSVSGGSHAG